MDYLGQLLVTVAVLQLVVNISQIVEIQLSLSLHVQKSEVSFAALLSKGVSLTRKIYTTLVVSYLKNCSKSRGAPWVES